MDRNQAGRRNLAEWELSRLWGRIYNRRKKAHGGAQPGNEHASKHRGKSCPDESERTADAVARESGRSPRTIKNDGAFASAFERVREEVEPKLEERMRGGEKIPRKAIVEAARVADEEREPEAAREVLNGARRP